MSAFTRGLLFNDDHPFDFDALVDWQAD